MNLLGSNSFAIAGRSGSVVLSSCIAPHFSDCGQRNPLSETSRCGCLRRAWIRGALTVGIVLALGNDMPAPTAKSFPTGADDYDVVIVGGGPAGSTAAIRLKQNNAALRVLLVDAAVFPREKLCGGGIVRQTDRLLGFLGLRINVPSVSIDTIQFAYPGGGSTQRGPKLFRVVRREDFDHALFKEAQARQVETLEDTRVRGLLRRADGIHLQAGSRALRAQVVIGADGARSVVRRTLVASQHSSRFVALETLTGIPGCRSAEAIAGTARCDFRSGAHGLRGYYWEFPSIRRGEPTMNRGLGGEAWPDNVSLKSLFATHLRERDVVLGNDDLQGATAPLYHPASPQSAERVVLAGDAVGIDPWFGEGISVAVGTGMLAAHAATEALTSGDFTFPRYRQRVADSATGWMLRKNRATARAFYRAGRMPGGMARWLGGAS